MEKEKPYQPTEEEMQKAESMMDMKQKALSSHREHFGGPQAQQVIEKRNKDREKEKMAEKMMSEKERKLSSIREKAFKGGDFGRGENITEWKTDSNFPYSSLEISEDGEIIFKERRPTLTGGEGTDTVLTLQEALLKLDEAQTYFEKFVAEAEEKVKKAKRTLEYCKASVDKIGSMKNKVSKIKEGK